MARSVTRINVAADARPHLQPRLTAVIVIGELGGARVQPYLISSATSIEAALKSVKLFDCIGKVCGHVGSRFAIQTLCLEQPGADGRVPEGAFEVASGLGVVVGAFPTFSVTNSSPRSRMPFMITFGFASTR
jgi:hypothetical protein